MTALFKDVNDKLDEEIPENEHPKNNRSQKVNFNELLVADDTICITDDPTAVQHLIRTIERVGKHYGMALNKDKCILIRYIPGEP